MYGRVEIDDETKKKLSLLLKYYRKKANLNQRDFITYNGATICSADTYSKIENCKIIKSNSIYHYLWYRFMLSSIFLPAGGSPGAPVFRSCWSW